MYTGTRPGVSPAIRAGKGWRGRRELAPRCSATRIKMHACSGMDKHTSVIVMSAPPPPPLTPSHTTTTTTRLKHVCDLLLFLRCEHMDESGRRPTTSGVARRRRERRLRSWWRHEQQSIRMALGAAAHHSAQQHAAPRSQRTGTRAGEGEVFVSRKAPRGQNTPHPENGLEPLEEVSEPQAGIRRHTASTSSWCSTPWSRRWWNSWLKSLRCLRLLWSTSHPRRQCYLQRQWWSLLHTFQQSFRHLFQWWSLLHPRQRCPNRQRQVGISHPLQPCFKHQRQWLAPLHPRLPCFKHQLQPAVSESPAPGVEYISLAPAGLFPVQVEEHIAPAPALFHASAPVMECSSPASLVFPSPAPIAECFSPAPAVSSSSVPVVGDFSLAPCGEFDALRWAGHRCGGGGVWSSSLGPARFSMW